MTKRLLIALFVATLAAPLPSDWTASAEAQERTSPAPTPPTPPPAPPEAPAKPVPPPPPPAPPAPQPSLAQSMANVQLDVTITDNVSGKPEAKRVTLVLRNGRPGSVRTEGQIFVQRTFHPVELALDGRVNILSPGLVEVSVTFTYGAPPTGSVVPEGEPQGVPVSSPAKVMENLTAVLRTGQPMLVSRSADPVTNRTVTVELTATIREP